MPYPANHCETVRKRIVHAARRLFNRSGFEAVSVNQIMSAAGLTRGGFYKYFASKGDLYIEVLSCFFTDPHWENQWEGIEIDSNAKCVAPQVVRAYLSRQHFENVEASCPMVALPSDVARADSKARRAFETVFQAMARYLQRDLQNRDFRGLATAQAIAALCIGGMVVARAMEDRTAADELREACMALALQLGGWGTTARGTRRSSRSASI
jgi:TetR/AcrR family transcriptional repressor of nem operon